jgi:hypothetical protein
MSSGRVVGFAFSSFDFNYSIFWIKTMKFHLTLQHILIGLGNAFSSHNNFDIFLGFWIGKKTTLKANANLQLKYSLRQLLTA